MLLPPELLTLLFLATASVAFPQNEPQANITAPSIEPTFNPTDPGQDLQPTETEIPWVDPCSTSSCMPVNIIPELPTATGWEVESDNLMPTGLLPPKQPDRVVTTKRPTIINIQTSTTPTGTQQAPSNNGSGRDNNNNNNNNESKDAPGQTTGTPVPAPQTTAGNNLLDDIVSRLGDAEPETQLPQAVSPTTDGGAFSAQHQQASGLPGATTSADADTAVPQATVTPGGVLTIGSATLTLTPGLSTTVGSAADATFVGITTDNPGQTIITISSSGTAITATMTDASATITLPKTGFEASITDVARPGVLTMSRADGAAASSSSQGAAVERRGEVDWWIGGILGLLGIGVVL